MGIVANAQDPELVAGRAAWVESPAGPQREVVTLAPLEVGRDRVSSTFCGAVNFCVAEGGTGSASGGGHIHTPAPSALATHFTEGQARPRQHPPLLWATTSQMRRQSRRCWGG